MGRTWAVYSIYVDEHIDSSTRATQWSSVWKNWRNLPVHCVCVCVIDTSDSIEYDSPRLSFNTQHSCRTATTCGSPYSYTCRAWASTTLATRRSVCTLTAAHTPEFSLWRNRVAAPAAMAFAVVLWFYFECPACPPTTSSSSSRGVGRVGWKSGYLVSWRCII